LHILQAANNRASGQRHLSSLRAQDMPGVQLRNIFNMERIRATVTIRQNDAGVIWLGKQNGEKRGSTIQI